MIEMETIKLTKEETVDLVVPYVGVDAIDIKNTINLLIKLGVISEFIFQEPPKSKSPLTGSKG